MDAKIENEAMTIAVPTNVTERPIRLIVDTGSQISIVAKDTIGPEVEIQPQKYNLTGISGKEHTVSTSGDVDARLMVGENTVPDRLTLAERRYAGPYDGYLGHAFLRENNAVIDMKNEEIKLEVKQEHSEEKSRESEFEIYACRQDRPNKQTTVENPQSDWEKLKLYEGLNLRINNEVNQYLLCFDESESEVPMKVVGSSRAHKATRHEQIMSEILLDNCDESQKQEVEDLVRKYPNQFYLQGDRLEVTDIIQHEIVLKPNATRVNLPQRRFPETLKRKMEEEVKELEEMGVISESTSPYNSRAFFVPKRDDAGKRVGDRMVIDYRELNDQIESEEYPIPLIDEIVDECSGCEFHTIIDVKSAYYHVELAPQSRHLTAFTAPHGKYQFNRVPMGLKDSPRVFQKVMNIIFRDLLGKGVAIYMDDIAISAKTRQEHDRLLRIVFERLSKNGFKLRINKCRFYAKEIHYLGFIISKDGIRPNPGKIVCVVKYPQPTNQIETQRFLGMINYYRRFIKDFSHIAKPLTKLTPQLAEFKWDKECQDAFDRLKNELVNHVTLKLPDFSMPFYITTDASAIACGATLSQGDPPKDRPIVFFSKTLSSTQQKYSTIQREILAIMMALEAFRPYIYGRRFTIITDHEPLKYLFGLKNPNSRLHQYRLELADLDFRIVYRPGKTNNVADALSRIDWKNTKTLEEVMKEASEENKTEKICRAITRARARMTEEEGQPNKTHRRVHIGTEPGKATAGKNHEIIFSVVDERNKEAIREVVGKHGFDERMAAKQFMEIGGGHWVTLANEENYEGISRAIREMLTICQEKEHRNIAINVILEKPARIFAFKYNLGEEFRRYRSDVTLYMNKIVALSDPREIETAMYQHHKTRFGGHCGIQRMHQTMKRLFTWKTMVEDIKRYVKQCDVCEKTKTTRNIRTPMQITSTGSKPFDHVFIDFIGPINPPSEDGHRHIFVATCDLTKYTVAIPTMNCTAETAAACFLNDIILKYGFPSCVTSDNGPAFIAQTFKDLNKKLNVKKITTTPYHPQSNIVERQNRIINAYLRAFIEKKPQQWASLIPYYMFCYNQTIHSTTQFSPHHLVYGYEITMPSQILRKTPVYNYDNYVDVMRRELFEAWELAKERLTDRKIYNKTQYDKRATTHDIEPGDFVLVKNQNPKGKHDVLWLGPYDIDWVDDKYVTIKMDGVYRKHSLDNVKKSEAWRLPPGAPERYILRIMRRIQREQESGQEA